MPKTPNLRTWEPDAGDAKHVDNTKMLDTTAKETPDTVNGTNSNTETVVSHPQFGPLGATGRV